jgi:hypothetical protein
MKTETIRKKVADLIDAGEDAPLPLACIPNYMGINLCSVDSVEWTRQEDGQLVNLTIHFTPAPPGLRRPRRTSSRASQ